MIEESGDAGIVGRVKNLTSKLSTMTKHQIKDELLAVAQSITSDSDESQIKMVAFHRYLLSFFELYFLG